MTFRQSFVFAPEGELGETKTFGGKWMVPPPGSTFAFSHSRAVERINEPGRKRWNDVNYGKLSGTWQWRFILDYEQLEPFLFQYENYVCTPGEDDITTHTFSKSEEDTVRPFSVRIKQINKSVGGTVDEVRELQGCVCTGLRANQSAGSSQINVILNGVYADERLVPIDLGTLDYTQKETHLVEYGCVYVDDQESPWGLIQGWNIQSQNSLQGVYSVGNPLMRAYWEGQTHAAFSVAMLSNDPDKLRSRLYSGGYSDKARAPFFEGSMPMKELHIRSTDGEYRALDVCVSECVVHQMSFGDDDGRIILDKLDGARCQDITISVTNLQPRSYWEGPHLIISSD